MSVAMGGSLMAAETSLSVDVASAYVFRGMALNDGLVIQPGLTTAIGSVEVGVWGNFDMENYDGALTKREFSEIDLSAAYSLPVDSLDLSVGYTEYAYTAGSVAADREIALTVGLDLPLAPSVGLFYGFGGAIEKSIYVEFGLEHELAVTDELGLGVSAALGYVNPDEGDAGFSHYSGKLGLNYFCLSASVTYVGQIDEDVLDDGPGSYDVELIGAVSLSWDL